MDQGIPVTMSTLGYLQFLQDVELTGNARTTKKQFTKLEINQNAEMSEENVPTDQHE
jgi:hypothetical protein